MNCRLLSHCTRMKPFILAACYQITRCHPQLTIIYAAAMETSNFPENEIDDACRRKG